MWRFSDSRCGGEGTCCGGWLKKCVTGVGVLAKSPILVLDYYHRNAILERKPHTFSPQALGPLLENNIARQRQDRRPGKEELVHLPSAQLSWHLIHTHTHTHTNITSVSSPPQLATRDTPIDGPSNKSPTGHATFCDSTFNSTRWPILIGRLDLVRPAPSACC